uniref:Uncharacterized protein n=1 Tax=Bombyx mori TaxID=7091 RepID=A0A8R2QZF5_BOMMO|nr:uncharacterized protein LOC110386242 [Bombyx mori]
MPLCARATFGNRLRISEKCNCRTWTGASKQYLERGHKTWCAAAEHRQRREARAAAANPDAPDVTQPSPPPSPPRCLQPPPDPTLVWLTVYTGLYTVLKFLSYYISEINKIERNENSSFKSNYPMGCKIIYLSIV